jgi:DegV family protein with EDD domain
MANARIVTDVTAFLDPDLIAQHRITVLPIDIKFGKKKFRVSTRQSWDKFFGHIADKPAETTEVSIAPDAFQQAFSHLNRETEEILVISSSGKLSDAYAQARLAARGFLGRCQIQVMDSMSASWGLGLLVKAAAEAAAEGLPLDAIVRLARGMLPHIYLVFAVERLDYLERGGRIGPAQALLGTMLQIKPILLVEDGEIVPVEKVRTWIAALEKLADFVAEFAAIQRVVILRSPLESDNTPQIEELREHLSLALPTQHLPIIEYDPILACHLGPEALGVVVYEGV